MNFQVSYLWPIVIGIGLIVFFVYYIIAMRPKKGTLQWIARREEKKKTKKRFTFTAPLHPMTGKDIVIMILLTVVYGLTAFFSLGDTEAPQSWLQMTTGEIVTFSSDETINISRIEYYTGLWTGTYELEISDDGENWTSVELEQDYAHLFYWIDVEMPEDVDIISGKYFRLSADCIYDQIELGEIGIFDEDENLITPANVEDAVQLFDEQDLVPDARTWTNSAYFDEIYHARTALENIRGADPYETTHPPLGKLIIALGIEMFGMTPFGWRFMGTVAGILMVPLLYIFLKNLFGKTVVALCGSALFTFDFMHLVQTRIATIDSYGVLFILAMYFFMYRYLAKPAGTPWRKSALPLFLSGLMFGIGAASKWIVIYGGVGLAILFFLNLFFKCRNWPKAEAKEDGQEDAIGDAPVSAVGWVTKTLLSAIVFFLIIPGLIYLASYLPMAYAEGVTDGKTFLSMVWDNQVFMLTYHMGVETPHPYESKWYQWILDIRPILYYMDNGAEVTTRFASWNNPIVSWGGLVAIVIVAVQTIRRRCWKGLFIVIGCLAEFVPWLFITRITFAYHYFPTSLFLCFALAYVINDLVESGRKWRAPVYALTGTAVGLYGMFYPALIGLTVPYWYMNTLICWLPSWPF